MIELLDEYTCILVGSNVITSKETGIKPLIYFIKENKDLNGYKLYDRIIGKAAALLIVYCGIKEVYAKVLSKKAIEVLEKNNIKYEYSILTDYIINRGKTDICPMEKSVEMIDDANIAYEALCKKIA